MAKAKRSQLTKKEIAAVIDRVVKYTQRMDFRWDWPGGVAFYGVAKAYETTKNEEYMLYLKGWVDENIAMGIPPLNINACAIGYALIAVYEYTKEETYLNLVKHCAEYLTNEAVRFGDGVFQHTVGQNYNFPEQAWADTLFMAGLFLVKAGKLLENEAYVQDGLKQFYWHIRFLQDRESQLFYHAWDNICGTNLSGVHWARANGWAAITMSEVTMLVDAFEPQFINISDALRDQLAALVRIQREDGMWSTVLDDESTYTETSAACAIAVGLINFDYNGYDKYIDKSVKGILEQIDHKGMVQGVSGGTAVMHTAADYQKIPNDRAQGWGQGLALAMLAKLYNRVNE